MTVGTDGDLYSPEALAQMAGTKVVGIDGAQVGSIIVGEMTPDGELALDIEITDEDVAQLIQW